MVGLQSARILICLLTVLATSAWGEAGPKAPAKTAVPADGRYQVQVIRTGASTFTVLRWNEKTGAAWYMSQGSWLQVREPAPIPASQYVVTGASLDSNWGAVRHDPVTGRSWIVDSGSWQAIPEAPLVTQPALGENPFTKKQ